MSNFLGLEEERAQTSEPSVATDDAETEARMRSGSSWFYWIAGLSAINSVIYLYGSDVAFLAGLGLTQLADALVDFAIEAGVPTAVRGVAVVFNFALVAMFAFFGYYAGKRSSFAFVVGIVIYVLDGLLMLLLGIVLAAGFHAFALFFII